MSSWLKSRIAKYGQASPFSLVDNSANYRKHPTAQRRALESTISEVGYVQPVLVNIHNNHIVDGHLRVEIAREHAVTQIPVVYLDITEDEELYLLSTIDPITNMATIDQKLFDDLLGVISSESQIINDMWESMQNEKLIASYSSTSYTHEGEQPPTAPNAYDIYVGMPEYKHENLRSYRSIVVHLRNEEDLIEFAKLMEQNVTDKTRFLWYPFQERGVYADQAYVDE